MINFCIFVFVFYALFAIIRMLIDYTVGDFAAGLKSKRRRSFYEKNSSGISVAETQRTDKAYF